MPNRLLGYVENLSGYYCGECAQVRPLFPTSERVALDLPLLGRVPFDPALAASCDDGVPFDNDRPAAATLDEIARRLVRALEESE